MITVCSYLQQAVLRFHYGMVSLFAINCSTVEVSALSCSLAEPDKLRPVNLISEALGGWRHFAIIERRTMLDFACWIRW